MNKRFGRLVKDHRKRLKITQDDLSKRVSLSRPSIANIERGQQRVQLHQLYELAGALETNIDSLLPRLDVSDLPKEVDQILEKEMRDATVKDKDWARRVIQSTNKG